MGTKRPKFSIREKLVDHQLTLIFVNTSGYTSELHGDTISTNNFRTEEFHTYGHHRLTMKFKREDITVGNHADYHYFSVVIEDTNMKYFRMRVTNLLAGNEVHAQFCHYPIHRCDIHGGFWGIWRVKVEKKQPTPEAQG